jgi:hypothetical protein
MPSVQHWHEHWIRHEEGTLFQNASRFLATPRWPSGGWNVMTRVQAKVCTRSMAAHHCTSVGGAGYQHRDPVVPRV